MPDLGCPIKVQMCVEGGGEPGRERRSVKIMQQALQLSRFQGLSAAQQGLRELCQQKTENRAPQETGLPFQPSAVAVSTPVQTSD